MSDSTIYNGQQTATSNGAQPNTGKVFNFSATLIGAPVAYDLKPLVNLNRLDNVQGVFLDNSAGTATLTCSTSVGQAIKVPAGYQAVMPIYLSADKVITLNGYGTVNIVLLNFSTPAEVWSAGSAAGPTYTSGGLLEVSDVALDACISGGLVNVNVISGGGGGGGGIGQVYGSADVTYYDHVGNLTAIQSQGGGGAATIVRASSGGYCYITGYKITLRAGSYAASPTVVRAYIESVISSIYAGGGYVTVPDAATDEDIVIDERQGIFIIDAESGPSSGFAAYTGSGSLTAGSFDFVVYYGITNSP